MPAVPRGYRAIRVLGVTLCLVNAVLWFSAPAIRNAVVDSKAAAFGPRYRPVVLNGVQELLVYFDPWLARGVFPVVYTFGLAAIPFLKKPPPDGEGSRAGPAFPIAVTVLLLAFEAVWLLLLGVGIFLRGPNWNLYWPGEAWVPRVEALNTANLSWLFWRDLFDITPDRFKPRYGAFAGILLRESPGIVLLLAYFLAGTALARFLFRASHRTTPLWRWVVLVLLVQLAALVPTKLILYGLLNLKYWIYVPESWPDYLFDV